MEILARKVPSGDGFVVQWRSSGSFDDFYGVPEVNLAKRHNRRSYNPTGCWYAINDLESHDDHAGFHPTIQDADDYIAIVLDQIKGVMKEHDRLVEILDTAEGEWDVDEWHEDAPDIPFTVVATV